MNRLLEEQCQEGYIQPWCESCDINAKFSDVSYGMNWRGVCQRCDDQTPTAMIFSFILCVLNNAILTYTVQAQSCKSIYLITLKQLDLYPFSRLRQPLNLQGAYTKVLMNYINLQSVLIFLHTQSMYLGLGTFGGIHGIVWFEDCYFTKISSDFHVSLMRIPITIGIIIFLFFVQILITQIVHKRAQITFKKGLSNVLYQQYWYLLIGAPTITLVFLPYMMCDTYVDENYIGSRVNPDLNCNSDIYTGLRWGLAFVFLLIQWTFLPYRTLKNVFVKRFELDNSINAIIADGGTFLEYEDRYFFWDFVKYGTKLLVITFLITLWKFKILAFILSIAVVTIYLICLYYFRPYKNTYLLQYDGMTHLSTGIAIIMVFFILFFENDYWIKLTQGMVFTIQLLLITIICIIIFSDSCCLTSINQSSILSILTGVHLSREKVRFQRVKKLWQNIHYMIKLNSLMKEMNIPNNGYKFEEQDINNYKQHVLKELFNQSQIFRKRLGIQLNKNYSIRSPFENPLRDYIQSFHGQSSESPLRSGQNMSREQGGDIDQTFYTRALKQYGQNMQNQNLTPNNRKLIKMPSYNVLQDHKLKKIIQEFDQEMLTFLFDKGSLINSDIIRINFTSKIRKLPVKEMTNILLEKAIYKEAIDQNMEKEFQDSTEKPVCIEYTIDIFNLGFDKISYVMIAIDDNEESDLIYLNENYSEITYENPLKLQLSYRVNIDDVNASVYLIGQFLYSETIYQFQILLCRSLIKLSEIKKVEKSNQQFKNKIKFKMISQSARFRLDFDKLQKFKEHRDAIFLKEVPVGTYDIQLLWKIYFPLKFLNERNNMFFYQMLVDTGINKATILVHIIREEADDKTQDKEELDRQRKVKLIQDGIIDIIRNYLIQY